MKKLSLLLLLAVAAISVSAQVIEHTYHFGNPSSKNIDEYQILNFEGCRPTGDIGTPILPWQHVSLMLPQGMEAKSIRIEFADFVELDGKYNLYPVQPDRPISAEGPFEFMKNEESYRSAEPFPTRVSSDVKTHYLNGVGFAFSGFTPMRYVAATKTVSYARTVKVTVETVASRADQSRKLWLRPENKKSMSKLAQNDDVLATYQRRDNALPTYEVLVITPTSYAGSFDSYIDQYASRGLRVRVAPVEGIYSSTSGRDNQEKIRNYIIHEYEENGIEMVVLGGDVNLVPYRSLWCFAQEGYEDNVPADLYYAALDGTWNDNNNYLWGEIGEDDLLPEIAISRMPFTNTSELTTILSKTHSYLDSPVLGEFRKTTFAGEHLGDGYYASNDLERLVGEVTFNGYTTYGFDEDIYDINRVYETPTHSWDPYELRDAIRQGTQYVNHLGHANIYYVSGWYNWDITPNFFAGANGVDHNFTIFQSQGCDCGDFPEDCILERLVLNQTGVLAVTGNSRYGWYSTAGDGPSAHYNRELVDAYCHERIPELAKAFKESKIQTAPFITMYGENGTMRWSMYALNALGDGNVSVWFDEPFTPSVTYPEMLQLGARNIPVDVKDENGNGMLNFRCSLFNGDELIGLATTDEEGHADIAIYPVNNGETLTLVVSGMNGWPQSFNMTFPDDNCAFVIYDNYKINDEDGQVDFNESQTLNMTFRNVGNMTANNVTATLTSNNNDYITVTQGEAAFTSLNGFDYITLDNAFEIHVGDNVPDLTEVTLTLSCTDGTDTWVSDFKIPVHAPNFTVTDIALEEIEGNGNGIADFGETIALHITVKNIGSSLAPDTHFGISCPSPEISFEQSAFEIGDLTAGDSQQIDVTLHIGETITVPTAFGMTLCVFSGQYVAYDNYFVNAGCDVEDFETGDFSKYDWQTNSGQPWFITAQNAFEGTYCAKSPVLYDYMSSSLWLDYTVECENEFSFYYKVSSEHSFDWLNFYLDDELLDRWSGEQGWARATFVLPAGQHQLRWEYAKDAGVAEGQDCAWVDFIVFPPDVVIVGLGNDIENEKTAIYPNPSNGDFTLDLAEPSDVDIYNSLGQHYMSLVKVEGRQNLHIDQTGMYIVRISTANGCETKKIIVK